MSSSDYDTDRQHPPGVTALFALAAAAALVASNLLTWGEAKRYYRRQYQHRRAGLERRLDGANTALRSADRVVESCDNQMAELRVALAAVELERDLRRPASPICEHLAYNGPATLDQLARRFGARTHEKLLSLMEAQEVTVDAAGAWAWLPPDRRRCLSRSDPTETIEAPAWLPRVVSGPIPGTRGA